MPNQIYQVAQRDYESFVAKPRSRLRGPLKNQGAGMKNCALLIPGIIFAVFVLQLADADAA